MTGKLKGQALLDAQNACNEAANRVIQLPHTSPQHSMSSTLRGIAKALPDLDHEIMQGITRSWHECNDYAKSGSIPWKAAAREMYIVFLLASQALHHDIGVKSIHDRKVPNNSGSKKTERIIRNIEFNADNYQAGINILSYFSTVIRKKYPNKKIKVKIEQEDCLVRLIIETNDGEIDVIEKELSQFGEVVRGNAGAASMGLSSLDTIELKNELRLAEIRVKMQEDLLKHRDNQIEKMFALIGDGLSGTNNIEITVSPNIITQTHVYNYHEALPEIRALFNGISENIFHDKQDGKKLNEALNKCEKDVSSKGKVGKESISTFAKVLKKVVAHTSSINKIIDNTENGMEKIDTIVDKTNKILNALGLSMIGL